MSKSKELTTVNLQEQSYRNAKSNNLDSILKGMNKAVNAISSNFEKSIYAENKGKINAFKSIMKIADAVGSLYEKCAKLEGTKKEYLLFPKEEAFNIKDAKIIDLGTLDEKNVLVKVSNVKTFFNLMLHMGSTPFGYEQVTKYKRLFDAKDKLEGATDEQIIGLSLNNVNKAKNVAKLLLEGSNLGNELKALTEGNNKGNDENPKPKPNERRIVKTFFNGTASVNLSYKRSKYSEAEVCKRLLNKLLEDFGLQALDPTLLISIKAQLRAEILAEQKGTSSFDNVIDDHAAEDAAKADMKADEFAEYEEV